MPNNPNSTPQPAAEAALSRGEFIRSLGMSSAALMAFYCMGTLSSCKGSSDPAPVTPPATGGTTGLTGNSVASGGAINFTLDLTNSNYSDLKTAGNFKAVGDVLVFNSAGSYKALSRICTHQGGSLSYRGGANNDIQCDLHSATYTIDGTPKTAPIGGGTTTAVKAYAATLSGNTLTVKA